MDEIRRFLSYLPGNNTLLPPEITPAEDAGLDQAAILDIPGVLGTGLFVGMANAVIVQDGEAVETKHR